MDAPFALTNIDLDEASILELQAAMERGELTSLALVRACLSRIAAYDQDGLRMPARTRPLGPAIRPLPFPPGTGRTGSR
ncbi:hypothetical protein [Cohnella fermenti]|uniref:Amidase n=1 Tax=Cohnella fermenti TaxID=2565925 RepID=A0A4S4BN38_9BACL|nr:hypothetical protein [Cohnella fermenti]THF76258.1 hypothetical protein E6C55_19730 [Cohnella fermenti]